VLGGRSRTAVPDGFMREAALCTWTALRAAGAV